MLPIRNPQPLAKSVDFDPFASGEVLVTALATESQKEIWASSQMGADANCAYNESVSLWLRGQLDVETLRSAFQELVQRHESLRMTFSPDGNNLCVTESPQLEIPVIDWAAANGLEREQRIASAKHEAVSTPFNLEQGPLFRVELFRLQSEEHLLILTAHHIVSDGWSWGIIIYELGKLYSAFYRGEIPNLEDPDRFSNYALTLEEAEGGEESIATENYWLQQFAESIPVVDFPTDRPRPLLRTFDSAREDLEISAELVSALKQLGSANGCSFMTVLLTGFETFLHRLTGQEDLVVGISAAGQAASGFYNLVGHCVNLLPLRTQVSSVQSFRDYLQSRKSTILDAYDHQQFTFGSLIKKLDISRDSSRIPLVSVVFNLDQSLEPEKFHFEGLQVEISSNPRAYENFELAINCTDRGGILIFECQYNTNLFDIQTIHYRLAEFETLLRSIVADPNQAIAQLPLLPESELQLLDSWNKTDALYDPTVLVHQLFEQQARQLPAALAIQAGSEQITYRELNIRANQLANRLTLLGVGPDMLVGICLERSPEFILAALSIFKASGAYVPLDPNYPTDRLAFMLEDSGVKILLTEQRFLTHIPTQGIKVLCLDTDWTEISQESCENLLNRATENNLAYVIYTSGSTGKPKGVEICHLGLLNLIFWHQQEYQVVSTDRATQIASPAFDASVWELWPYLTAGASIHIPDEETRRMPVKLADWLASQAITLSFLPTPLAEALLQEPLPPLLLRALLTGGDALHQVPTQFLSFQLINHYGPTENTVVATWTPIVSQNKLLSSPPIGQPIANTQVYVLDTNLQPVPIGIPGELYIGGVGLAKGYLNRPDLTVQKFITNPFSPNPNARLYKTGDLARWLSNGQIDYLGRIDGQVKVRGFRIELGEIEANLLKHPAVKEAVVVVREDVIGEHLLVGYFVPATRIPDNGYEQISELRQFLKSQLPDFMVPTYFMPLAALPLTPNSKVDRKALPKIDVSQQLTDCYVAPRTELEQQIADLWTNVMSIEKIGINDNFFELGGHSILAIQVITRLRKTLQIELPMTALFEFPTIADFANRIEMIRWATQAMQAPQTVASEEYEEGEL